MRGNARRCPARPRQPHPTPTLPVRRRTRRGRSLVPFLATAGEARQSPSLHRGGVRVGVKTPCSGEGLISGFVVPVNPGYVINAPLEPVTDRRQGPSHRRADRPGRIDERETPLQPVPRSSPVMAELQDHGAARVVDPGSASCPSWSWCVRWTRMAVQPRRACSRVLADPAQAARRPAPGPG